MDLKQAFYTAASFAWMGLVVGAWISVDQGLTEPWLSFSDIPGGSTGGMAGVIGLSFAGWVVISTLNERHESGKWQAAGQQAGLRLAGDSNDMSGPDLTGTVDGRTFTARYDKRKRGGGRGGSWVTFTFGEAALASPAEEGVVVGTAGGSVDAGVGTLDFDDMAGTVSAVEGLVAAETGDLVFVGTSAAVVEAVADGLSGDALRAVKDLKIGSLGDASGVVAMWAEARNEELEGSIVEFPVDNLVERVPGDAGTVTVETKASIRDGDELRRFAEAVVTIADAFEEATAHTPASG